jgi:hypothetical protein
MSSVNCNIATNDQNTDNQTTDKIISVINGKVYYGNVDISNSDKALHNTISNDDTQVALEEYFIY